MPSQAREQELLDRMWERVRPLVPARVPSPRGGRPWADDQACFAGIVSVLRNGVRWNALPGGFPSDTTRWRRQDEWTRAGVWAAVHRVILEELDAAGGLDTSELSADATFAGDRKGACSARTGCGVGVKIERVVDRTGVPVGLATDAASVPETARVIPAVDDIPATVLDPEDTPLVGDRAYDSDPLREELADRGFRLLAPPRQNRTRPSRNDGRRMRRFRRRWVVERTFARLHAYRRVVTRYDRRVHMHDGFTRLACAFIALNRLVK